MENVNFTILSIDILALRSADPKPSDPV